MPAHQSLPTAALLKQCKKEIVDLWAERAQARVLAALKQDRRSLVNSMPEYLDCMVESLAQTSSPAGGFLKRKQLAREHGKQRATLKEYSIAQLLTEYQLLRQVILEVLEKGRGPLDARERDTIFDYIQEAARDAATFFLSDRTVTANFQGSFFGLLKTLLKKAAGIYNSRSSELQTSRNLLEEKIEDHETSLLKASQDLKAQIHKTEVIKIQRDKFEEVVQRLKQERTLRETFVNLLAHDLRNPLSNASMAVKLMSGYAVTADRRAELSKLAFRNIERVDHMISDLLDANRIQAGENLALKIERCHLDKTAQEAIAALSLNYGNRFLFSGQGNFEGYWSCDGLRRVIENLLTNAVKYGAHETPIELRFEDHQTRVVLKVHNFGSLITDEEKKLLFKPFSRTHSAQAGEKKGWGLGLTLVAGITKSHGGIVSVESSEDLGTTFIVDIPRDARPGNSDAKVSSQPHLRH